VVKVLVSYAEKEGIFQGAAFAYRVEGGIFAGVISNLLVLVDI
jgi:hypothetical protein